MNFYLIGIDYKNTCLEIREEAFRLRKQIAGFWERFPDSCAAAFSTCNRLEIYLEDKDLIRLARRLDLFRESFAPLFKNAYLITRKKEIFSHFLRVATGLESQLRGEPQISQQLEYWRSQNALPEGLDKIAQEAIVAAARIREITGLNAKAHNLADIVLEDIRSEFTSLPIKVIIAGTGKIAEAFSRKETSEIKLIFAAHKNYSRAKELAAQSGAQAVSLKEIPGLLSEAQVLISATSSPHFIFWKRDFRAAGARDKKLFLYDLAFPRDIEPQATDTPAIVLKTPADLEEAFRRNNLRLRQELSFAEYLVRQALEEKFDAEKFKDRNAAEPAGLKAG